MNSFQCLANESDDSIFIEDANQLKKYKKKLKYCKTSQKSRDFQNAIDDYNLRNEKYVKKVMKSKKVTVKISE